VATNITINYDPNGTGGGQQEQALAKDAAAPAPELSPALTNFNEVLFGLGQKPLDTASLKLPTIESYYPEAAKTPATSSSAEGNPSAPRILFWYHPDYLGNVDLITERDGYTHEFFMYNPWGEEMHQWNANTYAFTSPYRFNSKELDPETGLAYYGARYYQNKLGVWLSVDPLAHERESLTPYNFVSNNSIHRVDPDGALDDWVQNIGTGGYEWKDNVTFANNTPEGYKYVGSRDADILKDLGVSYSFPEQSSNRIGYVAADVDMGKYAVNHLINVKAKSNVSISADVRYYLLDGTENNRFGKKFEGIKVSATVIGSNSDADGTVNTYSNLTVGYGGKTYSAGMKEPQLPYLKQTGTSVAVGSVNIPSSCLGRSNSFSGVRVSGGWWVTNTANMRTPVVNHPLIPTPQTFKHSWTFAKR
jgi:RHS repeat-associated protein